ncbi:MAG TPA: M15 family metallopeptidase [Actinomycetota bacterium]|nr:M15 family metallopeptidase [Actinomycetota bacterium]
MDPRIVEIFAKWGFAWGGHWSTPDPMHFELSRLLPS